MYMLNDLALICRCLLKKSVWKEFTTKKLTTIFLPLPLAASGYYRSVFLYAYLNSSPLS